MSMCMVWHRILFFALSFCRRNIFLCNQYFYIINASDDNVEERLLRFSTWICSSSQFYTASSPGSLLFASLSLHQHNYCYGPAGSHRGAFNSYSGRWPKTRLQTNDLQQLDWKRQTVYSQVGCMNSNGRCNYYYETWSASFPYFNKSPLLPKHVSKTSFM